jgi:MerR family transcriptional regulator, copper efflux regulator
MPATPTTSANLVPIDEVARRFNVRASAIRYYEERGLLEPASRHSGRRWYGPEQIRRLAIILYWQSSGLMSLDEIAGILAGPTGSQEWAQIVSEHIETLRRKAEQLTEAREYLEHVLSHHRHGPPDGCHHFETVIFAAHTEQGANDRPHKHW